MSTLEQYPILLCDVLTFTSSHLIFLSYTFCAHFLACIALERYTVILRRKFQLKRNMHWFMPTLTVYIIITWLAIVIENSYYGFIKGNTYCFLPKFEKEYKSSVHPFITTVVMITIWQTICNTITNLCTKWTIREIQKQQQIARSVLGNQVSAIETKRLRVTFSLSILFSLIWIPHGVQAIMSSYMPIRIAWSIRATTKVLVSGTFLVLPTVYYKMEKRFESFIKERFTFLSGNRVRHEA